MNTHNWIIGGLSFALLVTFMQLVDVARELEQITRVSKIKVICNQIPNGEPCEAVMMVIPEKLPNPR